MKTNLTILAAFVASALSSQIKVTQVTPTRICAGDSITVHYTWDSIPGLYQFNMDGANHDYIWQVNSNTFSNGKIKLKTPEWWNDGKSFISGDWVNSVNVDFCIQVVITEHDQSLKTTYKQVYGNIYLSNTGKKVIFVEP